MWIIRCCYSFFCLFWAAIRQLLHIDDVIVLLSFESITLWRILEAVDSVAYHDLVLLVGKTPSCDLSVCHEHWGWSIHANLWPITRSWSVVFSLSLNLIHHILMSLLISNSYPHRWHSRCLVAGHSALIKSNLKDSSKSVLSLKVQIHHTLVTIFSKMGIIRHPSIEWPFWQVFGKLKWLWGIPCQLFILLLLIYNWLEVIC